MVIDCWRIATRRHGKQFSIYGEFCCLAILSSWHNCGNFHASAKLQLTVISGCLLKTCLGSGMGFGLGTLLASLKFFHGI